MKSRSRRALPNGVGLALRLAAAVILVWIWVGFFFPDPFFVDGSNRGYRVLLWALRIGFPGLVGVAFILDRRIRDGRADPRELLLLAGGLMGAGLVAYTFVSWREERSIQRAAGQWHPYLQLDPPLYEARATAEGPAPLRVFCLGGSTTEFTDSKGRGWPERVEALLKATARPRPIEVHRLGRQWYTTLHTLINYEVNLRAHRPDVVVVMHAINDVLQNADFSYLSRGPFREDYGHFYGPLQRLALSARQPLPARIAQRLSALWYHRPRDVVETDVFPGLKPFERNLRSLIALARTDGTAVVLMTQPNLYDGATGPVERSHLHMLAFEAVGPNRRWSYETARRAMSAYNEATRRVATEVGVSLIDLEVLVPKDLQHFTDDVHYTEPAFDTVAEAVTRGLDTSGVLDHVAAEPTPPSGSPTR